MPNNPLSIQATGNISGSHILPEKIQAVQYGLKLGGNIYMIKTKVDTYREKRKMGLGESDHFSSTDQLID